MKSMLQRTLSGAFEAQDLGGGLWRLTTAAPDTAQVYLRVPAEANREALQQRGIERLDVEWRSEGITVRVIGKSGTQVLDALTVLIHEAGHRLYDGLPLAAFDRPARQFWRRVFFMIRIPGGRYLLRLLARRRR